MIDDTVNMPNEMWFFIDLKVSYSAIKWIFFRLVYRCRTLGGQVVCADAQSGIDIHNLKRLRTLMFSVHPLSLILIQVCIIINGLVKGRNQRAQNLWVLVWSHRSNWILSIRYKMLVRANTKYLLTIGSAAFASPTVCFWMINLFDYICRPNSFSMKPNKMETNGEEGTKTTNMPNIRIFRCVVVVNLLWQRQVNRKRLSSITKSETTIRHHLQTDLHALTYRHAPYETRGYRFSLPHLICNSNKWTQM